MIYFIKAFAGSSLGLVMATTLLGAGGEARAATTVFFTGAQTTNLVASGTTSDTISSEGYVFTFTRDKLYTGGTGQVIGRYLRVFWPAGLEAQAVTEGPVTSGAKMTIRRQDGAVFKVQSMTFELLANTYGAGGALEIMPLLNGEDGVPDPFMYGASGYYGQQFSYSTPGLAGFDTYKLSLYVDFALLSITLVDTTLPPPTLSIWPIDPTTVEVSWPPEATNYNLEASTSLASGNWTAVTNAVVDYGTYFSVQIATGTTPRFFRLKK